MNITNRINKLVLTRRPGINVRSVKRTISDACGISYEAVRQWFAGDTGSIKNENLMAIAEAFDTTVDWLLNGTGEPPRRGTNKETNVVEVDFSRNRIREGFVEIPQLDVAASMGHGYLRPEQETVIDSMTVGLDFLKQQRVLYSNTDNLALITGYGDSMEGTFNDGDVLLVDRGVNDVKIDAVYVLALKDELYIKRLQRRGDGTFSMISDNRKYDPILITGNDLDRFQVLGRVLLTWNAKKL